MSVSVSGNDFYKVLQGFFYKGFFTRFNNNYYPTIVERHNTST